MTSFWWKLFAILYPIHLAPSDIDESDGWGPSHKHKCQTMANACDFYFCCRHIVRLTVATNRTYSGLDVVDDALVSTFSAWTKVNRMRRLRIKSPGKVSKSNEVLFTVFDVSDASNTLWIVKSKFSSQRQKQNGCSLSLSVSLPIPPTLPIYLCVLLYFACALRCNSRAALKSHHK